MGDTLPEIKQGELDKLIMRDIIGTEDTPPMKSCEVFGDGKYRYTIIVPQTEYIRQTVANLGMLSNSVGGLDPEEVIENSKNRPKETRVKHKRKKRAKQNASV